MKKTDTEQRNLFKLQIIYYQIQQHQLMPNYKKKTSLSSFHHGL